jgi:hypothetical protein
VRVDPGSKTKFTIELPDRKSLFSLETEAGRVREGKERHPRNAKLQISVSCELFSKSKVWTELPERKSLFSLETEAGIGIEVKERHPRNAKASILCRCDGNIKANSVSEVHPLSDPSPRTSIESERRSLVRDTKSAKTSLSITFSFDPRSNDKISIELPEKQFGQSIDTEAGRQGDFNSEQPRNAKDSMRFSLVEGSNVNV